MPLAVEPSQEIPPPPAGSSKTSKPAAVTDKKLPGPAAEPLATPGAVTAPDTFSVPPINVLPTTSKVLEPDIEPATVNLCVGLAIPIPSLPSPVS